MNKFIIREYGGDYSLSEISRKLSIEEKKLVSLLTDLNYKILKNLGLNRNVITIGKDSFNVSDVAGVFSLNNNIEMQIIPKFIDENSENWIDDLFKIILLVDNRKIFFSNKISVDFHGEIGVYDIIANEFIRLFELNKRYFIRKYKKERFFSFSIEGDIVFDNIFEDKSEGIEQSKVSFTKRNIYNAIILKATNILIRKCDSIRIKNQLSNIKFFLEPQEKVVSMPSVKPRLNNRDKQWSKLYDLAYDIIKNFEITYKNKKYHCMPEYMFSTWQIWQRLIEISLLYCFKEKEILLQKSFKLGDKINIGKSKNRLEVKPDITVMNKDSKDVELLIDAKYKGSFINTKSSIDNSDVYEAYAFCKATKCNRILLIYPDTEKSEEKILGKLSVFSNIIIDGIEIIGAKLNIYGIGEKGAFVVYISNLKNELNKYLYTSILDVL